MCLAWPVPKASNTVFIPDVMQSDESAAGNTKHVPQACSRHGQRKIISVHLSQLCELVGTKQMYAWQMSAFACARHG